MSDEYFKSASKLKNFFKYWIISLFTAVIWIPLGVFLFATILSTPGIAVFVFLVVVFFLASFISSIVKSLKFYLLLGEIEEELSIPKKERAILKQLKTLSLLSALLSIFGGLFAFIPQFMFIFTANKLIKTESIED